MTVYKRPESAVWQCKFTLRGVAVRESTGCTSREDAEAWEARRRQEVLDGLQARQDARLRVPLAEVAERWLQATQATHADQKNNATRVRKLFGVGMVLDSTSGKWIEVEEMRYDTPRLVAPVGKAIELIFENPDVMPHNLVVVQPGARQRVSLAAMELPPEHVDRSGRAWVPESREIVAATKLLETGQSETLRLRPIAEEGVYEYVCTFPGHWTVMYGQLVVTKNVEAYLKANPSAQPAPAPAAAHAH